MPARPRAGRRADRRHLNGYHVTHLMVGHCFGIDTGFDHNEVAAQAAWNALKPELLQLHVGKAPGTRPWAWWQFDAPEPRQLLTDPHHCRRGEIMRRLYYGRPPIFACKLCFEDCWEVQPRYLRRLGLLTGDEAKIIPVAFNDIDDWWVERYGPDDSNPKVGSLQEFTRRYGAP